ncbi:hypothetical protein [Actinoplanes sp. CA-252034]|uniref:hypothetical protein n=1 Tax=Actinoplanes sp. CA-252034 TaxID=3239906 RepID=UPI003D9780C5
MALIKLAAGLAVGYVLGSRAGRDRYEQITATARKVAAHPTAVQAQEKAKSLLGNGVDAVNAKLDAAAVEQPPTTPLAVVGEPSTPRRKPRAGRASTLPTGDSSL